MKFNFINKFKKGKKETSGQNDHQTDNKQKKTVKGPNNHLIVDDSDINRIVLKNYLKNYGEKADEASDGYKAIEMCKINKYTFIWIDIKMPNISGIETIDQIRKDGYENIVIGVTGMVDDETKRKCIKVGFDNICPKPINDQTVYSIIEEYTSK